MAATSPSTDSEVPLWRLYVIRIACVYFAGWGFFNILPGVIDPEPTARGMINSMLAGLWVLVFFAFRYPLLLVPIFLFEFVWKTIWLLAFGLPQWMRGTGSPRLSQDLFDIGIGPLLFGLIIPWGYVWRHLHQGAVGTLALIGNLENLVGAWRQCPLSTQGGHWPQGLSIRKIAYWSQ